MMSCPLYANEKTDVLYIGYPKAASVFMVIGKFLETHPEVTIDHNRIGESAAAELCRDKIHISRDESIAGSLCVTGDVRNWRRHCHVPGAWDHVKSDILIDPGKAASGLRGIYPNAKILMVIREQPDWLNSVYKYSINQLPAARRSFADYCATPYGVVVLEAGYFDRTIGAYVDIFGSGRVCVLRYEDLVKSREQFAARLCGFIEISERPLPSRRENESHAQIARLLKLFPMIGRLPRKVKDAIKPQATRLLPGARGSLLSFREIRILRSIYAVSNQRTEKLIAQLS